MEVVLATIGCVTGIMGFMMGAASLIWIVGSARSTHQISYTPLDPMLEKDPIMEDVDDIPVRSEDSTLTTAENLELRKRRASNAASSLADIYGDLDD